MVDEDRSCSISAALGSTVYIPSVSKSSSTGGTVARCGSRLNPWVVNADTGQQIKINILDFGLSDGAVNHRQMTTAYVSSGKEHEHQDCAVHYGYILDKSAAAAFIDRNTTICASGTGLNRDRVVSQTRGSNVEIVLSTTNVGQDNKQHTFLLGVQGD